MNGTRVRPFVSLAGNDAIDEGHGRCQHHERVEEPVGLVETKDDDAGDRGVQTCVEHAPRTSIGRGAGVGDHEEREEQQRAALQLVHRHGHRIPQPQRAAEHDGRERQQKGVRDVAARCAVHDEPAEAREEEGEERRASPLTGGDPDAVAREEKRDEGDVRRIEDVLAAKANDELAADREDAGECGEARLVRPEEKAEREARDEGASDVETGEPHHSARDELGQERAPERGEDLDGRDRELQADHAEEQERGQDRDLVDARIPEVSWKLVHRLRLRRAHVRARSPGAGLAPRVGAVPPGRSPRQEWSRGAGRVRLPLRIDPLRLFSGIPPDAAGTPRTIEEGKMRRFHAPLLLGALMVVACAADDEQATGGAGKMPPAELAGVRMDMNVEEIAAHMAQIGEMSGGEEGVRGAKQFWQLPDGPYAWIAIRLDHERTIEWMTAFVREDGDPVPYTAIGDTSLAVRQGAYFFTWNVPADGLRDAYVVQARGNHPEHLMSVSVVRALR